MSSRTPTICGLWLSLFCLLSCLGCGEPNPLGRKAITGKIDFDGSRLESGVIEFVPDDPAGHSTGAVIANGEYAIEAHKGVPPGKYIVRITSPTDDSDPVPEEELLPPGPQGSGPSQPPPAKERIPSDYNTKSDKFVDVTADGPNQFDFDIPARRKK